MVSSQNPVAGWLARRQRARSPSVKPSTCVRQRVVQRAIAVSVLGLGDFGGQRVVVQHRAGGGATDKKPSRPTIRYFMSRDSSRYRARSCRAARPPPSTPVTVHAPRSGPATPSNSSLPASNVPGRPALRRELDFDLTASKRARFVAGVLERRVERSAASAGAVSNSAPRLGINSDQAVPAPSVVPLQCRAAKPITLPAASRTLKCSTSNGCSASPPASWQRPRAARACPVILAAHGTDAIGRQTNHELLARPPLATTDVCDGSRT